jgi:hypothetical protein
LHDLKHAAALGPVTGYGLYNRSRHQTNPPLDSRRACGVGCPSPDSDKTPRCDFDLKYADSEKLQSLADCIRGIERLCGQIASFERVAAKHLRELYAELERLEVLRTQLTGDLERAFKKSDRPPAAD